MRNRIAIPIIIAGLILIGLATGAILGRGSRTGLEFTLRDGVSKSWVWDATIVLQNRSMRLYYQSDRGVRPMTFTGLTRGAASLEISAPGYETRTIPVELKSGMNRLAEPIDLTGTRITDLQYFLVFEENDGNDIISEYRPVNSAGTAILNHPCLDIRIGVRVCEQLGPEGLATRPLESGAARGNELFKGMVAWSWDGSPETIFRYASRIPGAGLSSAAAYVVIDYLILVPMPGAGAIDDIAESALRDWDGISLQVLKDNLETHGDLFDFHIHTSWNVARGR